MSDTTPKPDLKSRALFAHMESLGQQEREEAKKAARELSERRTKFTHALRIVFQASEQEAEAAIAPDAAYAMLDGVHIWDGTYTQRWADGHGGTTSHTDVKCIVHLDRHDGKGAVRYTVRTLQEFGALLASGDGQLINLRTYVSLWRGEDEDYQTVTLPRAEADALLRQGEGWEEADEQ